MPASAVALFPEPVRFSCKREPCPSGDPGKSPATSLRTPLAAVAACGRKKGRSVMGCSGDTKSFISAPYKSIACAVLPVCAALVYMAEKPFMISLMELVT